MALKSPEKVFHHPKTLKGTPKLVASRRGVMSDPHATHPILKTENSEAERP